MQRCALHYIGKDYAETVSQRKEWHLNCYCISKSIYLLEGTAEAFREIVDLGKKE